MIRVITTILVLALMTSARAADWYLKPDAVGTSANTGTSWANAWTNAGAVVWGASGVKAGDTLWLGSGNDTNRLNVQASGTATNYIRIWHTVDPSHVGTGYKMTGTNGRVSLNSNDYLWLRGANTNAGLPGSTAHGITNAFLTTNLPPLIAWTIQQTNLNTVGILGQNCEGVIIEFIEIDGSPDGTAIASQDGNTGISFNGTDLTGTNILRYLYIHDMGQDCISGNNSPRTSINELRIEHCYLHRPGDDGIEWSGGATILNNRIQETTGQNGHPDAIQCPHDFWHIEGNIISDFNTGLIYGGTRHLTNQYFYAINNLLFMNLTNATQHPIQAINMDQTLLEFGTNYHFTNIVIAGNTIVNCNGGISFANRFAIGTSTNGNGQPYTNWLNISGLRIENNVFKSASNATSVGFSMKGLGHEGIIYTDTPAVNNNVLSGVTAARQVIWNGTTYADIVAYQSASGHGTANVTNAPTFSDASAGDYEPAIADTMLIDAGLDLSAYFTKDITGQSRDASFDIGAFEYIPPTVETNLIAHWTFEDDPSDGQIDDQSGTGLHMTRSGWPGIEHTNFVLRTVGRIGSYAGKFDAHWHRRPFTDTNFWDGRIGVVNLTNHNTARFTNITKFSLSWWQIFDDLPAGTNSTMDHNATVFDTGYAETGCLHVGRYYSTTYGQNRVMVNTNGGNISAAQQILFPTGSGYYTNNAWHHYAVTIDCSVSTNLLIEGYMDGTNCFSVTMPLLPANAVTGIKTTDPAGSSNPKWWAIGAWTHNGTLKMDDADEVPNNGWLRGSLDDIRIHDRILSPAEVSTLYGGSANITHHRQSMRGARMLIGGRRR